MGPPLRAPLVQHKACRRRAGAEVQLQRGRRLGLPIQDDPGARAEGRVDFAIRLTPEWRNPILVALPLEVGRFDYRPPSQPDAQSSNMSIAFVPEWAWVLVAGGGGSFSIAPFLGMGVALVGDDDSCFQRSNCDLFNHVVGIKGVLRGGVELRYPVNQFALWVRPLVVDVLVGGVSLVFLNSLAGVGVAF
jgi:hypothetical protein